MNSSYLWNHEINGPFNLANLHNDDEEFDWRQLRGWKINIWDQKFFSVNDKNDSLKIQHIVNRVFSPYLPMTKLLNIHNGEKNVWASIDVHDEKAEQILKTIDWTPRRINDLLRIIYQFIVLDADRWNEESETGNWKKNLENNIIFDFDYMLRGYFFTWQDNLFLNLTELTVNQKNEIVDILCFFREYIKMFLSEESTRDNLTEREKVLFVQWENKCKIIANSYSFMNIWYIWKKVSHWI